MTMPLLQKVDLRAIIFDHFGTLVDNSTGRTSVWDILLFYGAPAILVTVLLGFKVYVGDGTLGALTNAMAILAGLLFNLLVLLQVLAGPDPTNPVKLSARRLAQETYANIAYAIVVSLVSLVPLVIGANYRADSLGRWVAGNISAGLILHFALTLCMVIKRMHVMLEQEFQR